LVPPEKDRLRFSRAMVWIIDHREMPVYHLFRCWFCDKVITRTIYSGKNGDEMTRYSMTGVFLIMLMTVYCPVTTLGEYHAEKKETVVEVDLSKQFRGDSKELKGTTIFSNSGDTIFNY
jgi:hypothetical protein